MRRTIMSNERKYALSIVKSSKSSCVFGLGGGSARHSKDANHGICAFELRERRAHALHDGMVDLGHRFSHPLMELDYVGSLLVQRLLDLRVEAAGA